MSNFDARKARAYLDGVSSSVVEDGFFGMFDRSAAAKKGWETRKSGGGWAGKGLASSGKNIPTWSGGAPAVQAPAVKPVSPVKPQVNAVDPKTAKRKAMEKWLLNLGGDQWVG